MKKFILLILVTGVISSNAYSQNEKFKALFMFNFTKYIEWPPSQRQGEFIIGVLGSTTLTKELEVIATKQKIGVQNMVVKSFSSVEEIQNCHILYISPSKSSLITQVVGKVGKGTLIISDKQGLALKGAGINYIMDGDKLKYEINKTNIESKGLSVSNSLMGLGIAVNN